MVIVVLFTFLLQYHSVWPLENDLLESLEKAMRCTHREPPREPVMAMTPKKYSQLVALIRRNLDTPPCNKNKPMAAFDIYNEHTWNFCVFGKCQNKECLCLRPYTGFNCATYKGKCWIMYCFLSGCHPAHQSMTCKCDPQLYGTRVLTGEYWYDNGKRNVFEYPPPNWRDDVTSTYNSKGQIKEDIGNEDYVVIGQTGIFGNLQGNMRQVWQAPQIFESTKKIPGDRKHEGRTGLRNKEQMKPSQSKSEGEKTFQRGHSQRLQMNEPGNENWNQNSKTAIDVNRFDNQKQDTTEDLKEALEEVEMENSASLLVVKNTFYIVIFLSLLLIL